MAPLNTQLPPSQNNIILLNKTKCFFTGDASISEIVKSKMVASMKMQLFFNPVLLPA